MQERSLDPTQFEVELLKTDPFSVATHLWARLDEMHRRVNAAVRNEPSAPLAERDRTGINALLRQIIGLIGEHELAKGLRLLPTDASVTVADTLILLGQYKGALRAYRVFVLSEGQYSF